MEAATTTTAPKPIAGVRTPRAIPATADLQRILTAPRVPLGRWPTPLETVEFAGNSILVKRDDLSDFGRGGSKTRKLEHVLGLMRARGCDELITVVGNITNLGFDLLPALRAHGFSWRIFVQNDPPLPDALRRRLFSPIDSDLLFLGSSRLISSAHVLAEWVRRRAAGKKPFLLLPGASHPAGVVGNAWGFVEMAHQLQAAALPMPERVFVSVATGTTIAGFLIAENALRHAGFDPVQIVGVQVYPGNVARRTRLLLRWTERHLGLERAVDFARIDIRAGALAGGFGRVDADLEQLCDQVESQTGLRMDPIFGGKTWSIMRTAARPGPQPGRPILFWHCGHTPEWKALVRAVRSPRGVECVPSPSGLPDALEWTPRKLAIIAAYAAAFYGILTVFLWSFGRRLDEVFGLPPMHGAAAPFLGAAVLVLGAGIVVSSILLLIRIGHGLPISHLPPRRLVDLGSYRWTRHPHYVGYNLAFVGCGLLQASWGRAVGAGLLLLGCWLLYALVFEEPRLLRRYGLGYAAYRTCVRVLPGPSPRRLFQAFVTRLNRPLEALANRVELLRTGPLIWVTYGLFAAAGAAAMALGFAMFLLDRGQPGLAAWRSVLLVSLAIAVISRAAWFVLPGDKPQTTFRNLFRRVGFTSWGGYAAGFGTAVWIGYRAGIPALRMLDAVMLTGLFASAVSRWGCLTYGCCIGRSAPWGLRWTHPDAWIHRLRPGGATPRIPTQLLSSLHALIAGWLLLVLSFRASAPGALAALGGILYALPRFGVEHLREEARFGRWQLTAGQTGSAVVFVLSVLLLYFAPGPPAPFWVGAGPLLSPALLPAAATAFGVVFLAYGVHWKRIGHW